MGTYTANYQLYMPSIGEQGWGDLMNGNLTTIDTTMKGLNTRIGTLETETDAVEERVTALERGLSVDSDGSVTANNGIIGNFTGLLFVPGIVQEKSGDVGYARCTEVALSSSYNNITITVPNECSEIVYPELVTHTFGIYTRRDKDIVRDVPLTVSTRPLSFKGISKAIYLHYRNVTTGETTYSSALNYTNGAPQYFNVNLIAGDTYEIYVTLSNDGSRTQDYSIYFPAYVGLYVKYNTP